MNERSRFWAQATYLSGVLEVERKNYREGERLFCKLADPKKTPRQAALFGGGDFFRVRDLARLGLGRVAHEQYRFDDARYYYYLVPQDSERLPEALYETATTRYEAKDYDGARQSMDDLRRLATNHPYEDEAWILDAYIDLAVCRFPQADKKLNEFLKRYEPVRDAARRLAPDEQAMKRLTETLQDRRRSRFRRSRRARFDGARAGLAASHRYGLRPRDASARRARLPGERLAPRDVRPRRGTQTPREPERRGAAGGGPHGQERRRTARARRIAARRGAAPAPAGGGEGYRQGETRTAAPGPCGARGPGARGAGRAAADRSRAAASGPSGELEDLLAAERTRATELWGKAVILREEVEKQQLALAKDAFERVDKRLTRLLRRARLGRVETVLGKKRSLELEVEALSQGLLPQTIVDSLDAARHLGDDEEYWPFEGEDWEDEYVGGEGVR